MKILKLYSIHIMYKPLELYF